MASRKSMAIMAIPKYCTTLRTFGERRTPKIASIIELKTKKPSRIGNGKRFIMKRETQIKAMKFNTETSPLLKPAEKPALAVSPIMLVILAGPAMLSDTFTPLKRLAIPLKERAIR